jgi:hypothetical protein
LRFRPCPWRKGRSSLQYLAYQPGGPGCTFQSIYRHGCIEWSELGRHCHLYQAKVVKKPRPQDRFFCHRNTLSLIASES